MDTPETKYYMGCDTYNGVHAYVIVDQNQKVVKCLQTPDKKEFDLDMKKQIEFYKIPSERIITFCSYAKAGFKKHLPVGSHKLN